MLFMANFDHKSELTTSSYRACYTLTKNYQHAKSSLEAAQQRQQAYYNRNRFVEYKKLR